MRSQIFSLIYCVLLAEFAFAGPVVVHKPLAPPISSIIRIVPKDSAVLGTVIRTQVGPVSIDSAASYDLTFRIGAGPLERRQLDGEKVIATIKELEAGALRQNVLLSIVELLKKPK